MRFAVGTALSLQPVSAPVPFVQILTGWMDAGFEPDECRAVLESFIEKKGVPRHFFNLDEIGLGGRPATDALLFEFFTDRRDWVFAVRSLQDGHAQVAGVRLPVRSVPLVSNLVRAARAASGPSAIDPRFRTMVGEQLWRAICSISTTDPKLDDAPHGWWPAVDGPGIYRREHASLLIRSRTTSILIDPQCMHWCQTTNMSRYPWDKGPLSIDGIAITHHHSDHWHIPSILYHAAENHDVPVIVPDVPQQSLLTEEKFAHSLQLVGLDAVVMPWGATTKIGDIEIDALPFYGEQPVRDPPALEPSLRMWGNCYRFTCPDFSVILLVDSGEDPSGGMVEVVRASVERRGPVNAILANCRSFPEAINRGLPHYFLTLPFCRLQSIYRSAKTRPMKSITLGGDGIAAACGAAKARYFLPYAHMFAGLGQDVDGEAAQEVINALSRSEVDSKVLAWSPGDVARFDSGAVNIIQPSGRKKS
jgi:L-ascorbate metabolism protein UlaG (beta-lactamase superfamily)